MIRTPITVELAEKERGYRLQEIAKLNQAVDDLMKARDHLTGQPEAAAAKLKAAAEERDRLVPEHQAVADDMGDWAAKGRADLGLPRPTPDEPGRAWTDVDGNTWAQHPFSEFVGHRAEIVCTDGRAFTGDVLSAQNGHVGLSLPEGAIDIPLEQIERARTATDGRYVKDVKDAKDTGDTRDDLEAK
jgi:hypothetical protein